jgi:hypothetical protein
VAGEQLQDHDDYDYSGYTDEEEESLLALGGAVPTYCGTLTNQAKEFWFPESRDCKCCKGFKYGCICSASAIIDEGCSHCTTDDLDKTINAVYPVTAAAADKNICRFFRSGQCMKGEDCSYAHI